VDTAKRLGQALAQPLRYFFFSSTRRHTRSDRDWSSDVCSSDLPRIWTPRHRRPRRALPAHRLLLLRLRRRQPRAPQRWSETTLRSEERRVGKGCRARWLALAYKKKVGKRGCEARCRLRR